MDPKAEAREHLNAAYPNLIALSHRIHGHPEVGWEEESACQWLCEELSAAGFTVSSGICELATAFEARTGSGPLQLAICAEYDSLPGIGHACGHNIIAAMAVGAAVAAAKVADDLGLTLRVLGTPAEEVCEAGGKILLLERGAFDGVHAAMMVHPAPVDMLEPPVLAASMLEIRYTGKEAHASAFPQMGINAADALTVAQVAIGLLRQHIRATDRVHGFITKGGDAANVVPAHTSASYMVRARTLRDLAEVTKKVRGCFEAGAIATGAKLEISGGEKPYAEMRHHSELAAVYRGNAEALGRSLMTPRAPERMAGSTDMGNVSLRLPSIHPMISINSLPAVNHQPEFAAACITAEADRALFEGALAMAWTAIDVAADRGIRDRLMRGSS